jgi:hypothetical protein
MKKITYIIAAILVVVGVYSCKKRDDLFVSPNDPTSATAASLLAGIEVSTFNILETVPAKMASIFIQYNAGIDNQTLPMEQYDITEDAVDNTWSTLYANMFNCKILSEDYGDKSPHFRGISKILMAMNLGIATDMWGDVPFSEALKGASTGGNFTPKYDSQKQILESMQLLLDEGIVELSKDKNDNLFKPNEKSDFIFSGDATKWIKTAYTLKARYYLRLSKKGFDATTLLSYTSKGIQSNADNCYAKHKSGGTESNQWADFLNNRPGYIAASQVLIDSMGNMLDPRTPQYFDTTLFAGKAVGSPLGGSNKNASYWGPYLGGVQPGTKDLKGNFDVNAGKSIPLVTFAEAKFIEAEGKIYLNDASAFTTLNDAIKASVMEVTEGKKDGSSIATYTALNTNLRTVMLEKWKAMFAQPIEAYSDFRRTGFPNLTPNPSPKAALKFIPKRLPTAITERTLNPNAPTPALSVPVWYAE